MDKFQSILMGIMALIMIFDANYVASACFMIASALYSGGKD